MSGPVNGRVLTGVPFSPETSGEFAVFRESFLSVHLSDENADALRIFGRLLYDKVVTSLEEQRTEVSDQIYFLDLKASVLDLINARGVLQMLALAAEEFKVGAPVEEFSAVAQKVQKVLGELIEEMEAVLAAHASLEDPELPAGYLEEMNRRDNLKFVGNIRTYAENTEDGEEKKIMFGVLKKIMAAESQNNPSGGNGAGKKASRAGQEARKGTNGT